MDENTTLEKEADVKNGVKRLIFAGIAIVLQLAVILLINLRFAQQAEWFAIGMRVLGAMLVLYIYNNRTPSAMKMTWIIVIMALPVFGASFYMLTGLNRSTHRMRKRFEDVDAKLFPLLPNGSAPLARLDEVDGRGANISRYLTPCMTTRPSPTTMTPPRASRRRRRS